MDGKVYLSLLSDPATFSYVTKLRGSIKDKLKMLIFSWIFLLFENIIHILFDIVIYQTNRDVNLIMSCYKKNARILTNHPKLYCNTMDFSLVKKDDTIIIVGWIASFVGEYKIFANELLLILLMYVRKHNLMIRFKLAGKNCENFVDDFYPEYSDLVLASKYVENLKEFYNSCHLTIGSGRKEYGLYNKVHESMYYGVPVLSNINGLYPFNAHEMETTSYIYFNYDELEKILLKINCSNLEKKRAACLKYSCDSYRQNFIVAEALQTEIKERL